MYHEYSVNLSEGQKVSIAKAFKTRSPVVLRLSNHQLVGNDKLMLTANQIKRINAAKLKGVGVEITLSKTQITKQKGGFLGPLIGMLTKTVLPAVTRIAPKILSPLATGALSGLASTGIGKLFGNGMIPLDPLRKMAFLMHANKYLNNAQKERLLTHDDIRLTKSQQQNGGFLPFLLGALAPTVLGALFGKGLQVDPTGVYRRIPPKKLSTSRSVTSTFTTGLKSSI